MLTESIEVLRVDRVESTLKPTGGNIKVLSLLEIFAELEEHIGHLFSTFRRSLRDARKFVIHVFGGVESVLLPCLEDRCQRPSLKSLIRRTKVIRQTR